MQFDYMYIAEAQGSIEIEDLGNFAISVTNDLFQEYLMVAVTTYGITEIIEYGPIKIDFDELCPFTNYSYRRIDYSEYNLKKLINKLLNDEKKNITQVTLIDFDEAKNKIRNFIEVVENNYNLLKDVNSNG